VQPFCRLPSGFWFIKVDPDFVPHENMFSAPVWHPCKISTLKWLRSLVNARTAEQSGTYFFRWYAAVATYHSINSADAVKECNGEHFKCFSCYSLFNPSYWRTIFKSTVSSPYAPSKRSWVEVDLWPRIIRNSIIARVLKHTSPWNFILKRGAATY